VKSTKQQNHALTRDENRRNAIKESRAKTDLIFWTIIAFACSVNFRLCMMHNGGVKCDSISEVIVNFVESMMLLALMVFSFCKVLEKHFNWKGLQK